jgi:hypothetical protein
MVFQRRDKYSVFGWIQIIILGEFPMLWKMLRSRVLEKWGKTQRQGNCRDSQTDAWRLGVNFYAALTVLEVFCRTAVTTVPRRRR